MAQCYLVGALGRCAAAGRDMRRAAELLGAAASMRAEIGASVHPGMAPALAQAGESATAAIGAAAIGAAAFGAAYNAGRRPGRDAAVRLALRYAVRETPAEASPAATDALSPREADVARLVSDGLSNREIGARPFISERTVESHVRSILNKLGFTSRTRIASWVAARNRPGG